MRISQIFGTSMKIVSPKINGNLFVIQMRMALLKYLREKAILPNPNRPSAAISSANKEAKDLVDATPNSPIK